ncbi:MAG: zf-HC2 domain-containing protein [Pseudohongiellaceae bacterium]
MLKCRDISLHTSDYLEKSLPANQRLAFAFHLLMCGRCRDFVRHMEKAIATFNELEPTEMSRDDAEVLGEVIVAKASDAENRKSE